MNKRGRPFKPKNLVKRHIVPVRCLDSEKQAFEEAANLAGIPLSSWMRERLRNIARKELDNAKKKNKFFP